MCVFLKKLVNLASASLKNCINGALVVSVVPLQVQTAENSNLLLVYSSAHYIKGDGCSPFSQRYQFFCDDDDSTNICAPLEDPYGCRKTLAVTIIGLPRDGSRNLFGKSSHADWWNVAWQIVFVAWRISPAWLCTRSLQRNRKYSGCLESH